MTARSVIREVYGSVSAPSADAEERLFTKIRLPSGVFKTTARNRLEDLNQLVIGLLPEERPLELMDVGISSGVTTGDWSRQLTAAGIAHHMLAGDSHIEGEWLSFRWAEVLLDGTRSHVLYGELFGRAVNINCDSTHSVLLAHALKLLARCSRLLRSQARRVQLVSPMLEEYQAITVVEDDIFARRPEMAGRFHVVRAANILNRGYFDDDRLRTAVANLGDRLRPNGLLIVCRTHPDYTNHGTVFRRSDRCWVPIVRIGDGSEIEALVATP